MSIVGHNSIAKDQLKSIIERVERLEEDKASIGSDIKDVYAEAKGNGYDVKALRAIVRRKRADAKKLAELEANVDLYMASLGMI